MSLKWKSETDDKVKDENAKTEFSFVYKVCNFNSLATSPKVHYSEVCTILGLKWYLSIEKSTSQNYLAVYLNCENPSDSALWSCFVKVRITVLSQMESVASDSSVFERLFSSTKSGWGCPEFRKLDEITDPKKGFFKNDAIKLQVHIIADVPKNVGHCSVKENPKTSSDVLSAFEKEINGRIVSRLSDELKMLKKDMNKDLSKSMEKLRKDLNEKINSVVKETRTKQLFTDETFSVMEEVRNKMVHMEEKLSVMDELRTKMLVIVEKNYTNELLPKILSIGEKLDKLSLSSGDYKGDNKDQKPEKRTVVEGSADPDPLPTILKELVNLRNEMKKSSTQQRDKEAVHCSNLSHCGHYCRANFGSRDSWRPQGSFCRHGNSLRSSISMERESASNSSVMNLSAKSKVCLPKSNSQNNDHFIEQNKEQKRYYGHFIEKCDDDKIEVHKIRNSEEQLQLK